METLHEGQERKTIPENIFFGFFSLESSQTAISCDVALSRTFHNFNNNRPLYALVKNINDRVSVCASYIRVETTGSCRFFRQKLLLLHRVNFHDSQSTYGSKRVVVTQENISWILKEFALPRRFKSLGVHEVFCLLSHFIYCLHGTCFDIFVMLLF